MPEEEKKLEKFVNSSGFPLQIGLHHLIDKTRSNHGWKVLSSEHPWHNIESGKSGFADLILENQHQVQLMVIECKRVRDTSWVFLVPSKQPKSRRHANTWVTNIRDGKLIHFDWVDLTLDPVSPQAEFCVIPGQDPRSKPMLERTSADLIEATESIANEEYQIHRSGQEFLRIYFSAIVTTAEIKVCFFDPDEIDVKTGEITNAQFETVPYLRFRKSLSTKSNKNLKAQHIMEAVRAKERTVFVVNSNEINKLLREWDIDRFPANVIYNW